MIVDSHAHLYWKSFDDDRDEVLARAREAGVGRMIIVGTDLATSRAAFELAAGELELYPTAGIHPHDAGKELAARHDERAGVEALCRRPECVGVGETGLDYFKEYAPRADQLESFAIALLRRDAGVGDPPDQPHSHCHWVGWLVWSERGQALF